MTELMTEEKKQFHFAEGQLLLVNKPYEWTSFDVVGKLRNTMKPLKIKVGHAGTLDPLATGLLIICTGKMTKQIDSFQAEDKEYTGIITLGATTPTFDLESDIDQTFDISTITEEAIQHTAASFVGEQEQYPPAHSAIKVDGERVYEKARRGETVILKPRQITVHSFDIEKIEMPNIHFRIKCTKGTYIRSIANDFGQRLKNGSHLSALCRTKSGDFRLEDAWNLQDLIEAIKLDKQ
ncbi:MULTISPECIES: tRNA pseudouridine(55) synthase TruB [Sphingobacterium]|uniref:tRNA pseudouridine synthase B n=1 Tax=Sphingobacterium populi TaxID=1812824 RepID=A0ABW5UF31_9SPHI|nr:tRNA pseudouridine(55) synthase TruB [Sphingobacterium sp. CFCC 11742]